MNVESATKKELLDYIVSLMIEPNMKVSKQSEEDEAKFASFIKDVKSNKKTFIKLPLEFALRADMFDLIKAKKVFMDKSVKFSAIFTTTKQNTIGANSFSSRYIGNEFNYSFLDNHPGIINVDNIKDIPIDYEGLMAVPVTVLSYKNIARFNIHRVIYTPKHRGKYIYPRVVVSNKFANIE